MLSLGIEVDGETLDLVPLLADLIKRDARWLDAREIGTEASTMLAEAEVDNSGG